VDALLEGSAPTAPALAASGPRRPRIVIVGAGFGGLEAAMHLGKAEADITVVDRRNYHLFQPLLYQVATAVLSPADIAQPIRSILSPHVNTRAMFASVTGVDIAGHAVLLHGRRLSYDQLVIATGARSHYFGHDEWAQFAPGLKTVEDATAMRRHILLAFEHAEDTDDLAERRRLMTFVVIGGGATGVELAGSLAELARSSLVRDFRRIDPASARIVLVESEQRLLPGFPPRLAAAAARALRRLGVELRLGVSVRNCDAAGADLDGERIESRNLIWAAGVAASPAAACLGAACGRGGRIRVRPDLTLPGHPEIFAIGDVAEVEDWPLPGVAAVAKQQGAYVARVIACRIAGTAPPGRFRYRNLGNVATIGRKEAVVDFGWLRFSGRIAWLIWSIAHIYYLIGFRNRTAIAFAWLWTYLTDERGVRLITGAEG
jgi:NADH:quinone reductase (non-electrogenic)